MEKFAQLKEFLLNSQTPYHFTDYSRKLLKEAGFEEIQEKNKPENIPKKGFFIRDDRCLICWNDNGHKHGSIICSHCDSPSLILKPNFGDSTLDYARVRCSVYGGGLWYSWIGRELKLCGKVVASEGKNKPKKTLLYDSKRAIGMIPYSQVDPLNPSFNAETDFHVYYGSWKPSKLLLDQVASELGIESKHIETFDLRFVDANPPNLFSGIITAQKLDDLVCTFSGFTSFLQSEPTEGVTNIFIAFDNEEIGSSTQCGGKADIINDVISLLITDEQEKRVFKRRSIIGSFDVVHASHPNYEDKTDPKHIVAQGKGVTLGTDCGVCNTDLDVLIPLFEYINMNKQSNGPVSKGQIAIDYGPGSGSTVGPMVEERSGILTFDFGQPLLGMHSIRETASLKDLDDCYNFCHKFYSMTIDEWNNFI